MPEGLSIRSARSGAEIAYHADRASDGVSLRRALLDCCIAATCRRRLSTAVAEQPDVILRLGTTAARISPFTPTASPRICVTPAASPKSAVSALIGADGLWSTTRAQLGDTVETGIPQSHRLARPPAGRRLVRENCAGPSSRLWLGENAHLVHYPLRGGTLINVVAIVRDRWNRAGLVGAGQRARNCWRTLRPDAGPSPRAICVATPESWMKWALFDRIDPGFPSLGPVTSARRCRASDAAVPRAGRGDGHRGCRGSGPLPGLARCRSGARHAPLRGDAPRAGAASAAARRAPTAARIICPARPRSPAIWRCA